MSLQTFKDWLTENAYFTGLSPSTIDKKKAQMAKQAAMDSDDPAAYKEMPGDTKGRKTSKVSKFTQKYKDLFGEKEQEITEKSEILSSLVNQDQKERSDYANFVKNKAGGDFTKGSTLYAKLKNRSTDDIFGEKENLKKFVKINFDFKTFTREDWKNYWLLAQHSDFDRPFQQKALNYIKEYLGDKSKEYKYLYDRLSCSSSGTQKYNTQDICTIDESVSLHEKSTARGPIDNEKIEKALQKKSEATGISIGILRAVMRRGMGAWKSGHRPGATQEQWGYARVNSFATKSPGTWGKADADLAAEVRDKK